jgi:isoleucyl-tRNA synthetase
VLDGLAKYMAPMAPFFADWLYLSVYGTQESVHLEEWPQIHTFDEQIIKEMEKVRDMVSELLEYRQKANIKVRQPLAKVTVREEIPLQYKDIILDELNIKEIIVDSRQESSYVLDTHLTQDLIEEGMVRDLIRAIQDARKKEGLTPSQTIKLSLSTTQKDITYRFEQMIKEPTGITNIVYTQDSHAYTIAFGEGQLSFSLVY